MTWQRYLTDAERKYRPAYMQAIYAVPLAFTIKGVPFRRWFRTVQERDNYAVKELQSGALGRLIDNPGQEITP